MTQLRVLQGERNPDSNANPYIPQLFDALREEEITVLPFTWVAALTSKYDVVHVHWPEFLVQKRSLIKTLIARVLLLVWLSRIRAFRTPVVWTVHNPTPHELPSRVGEFLLKLFRSNVALEIHLSEKTASASSRPSAVIPHGHYRDWFAGYSRSDSCSESVLFFGQLRPYKNVEALISAVASEECRFQVKIAGNGPAEYVRALEELACNTNNVQFDIGFVTDVSLVRLVSESRLVILPYDSVNSGALLLALSLDTPVLVPENDFVRGLASEVGREWVNTYTGELTAKVIEEAIERAETLPASPDLSKRDWAVAGNEHCAAYRRAIRLRKSRS